MIKIIISGTYDGFYPRYATDGNLEDSICRKILDRRMYFSKAENSLFKEGYSFQLVNGAGIFYHKMILLFDALGRDGFMMASIFLPIGDKLEGNDIKDALDSIIRDYKARTNRGMANIDVDWSFVNRKADELNGKVMEMDWRKRPILNSDSRTALIKGVLDNRVADYFQYPNPLHKSCNEYGQVFLTESLMDPAMISEDGTQGYQVLSTDQVNIDNPEYDITYISTQNYDTHGLRQEVSQKELNEGDVDCGELSSQGYRPRKITIPKGTKSEDGLTINVVLTDLVPMSASLTLLIKSGNKEIPASDCDITCTNNAAVKKVKGSVVTFSRDECEKTWTITVKCEGYKPFTKEGICIKDLDRKEQVVRMEPVPLWSIYYTTQNSSQPTCFAEKITEEELDSKIKEFKQSLDRKGMTTDEDEHIDREKRIITFKAKKKPRVTSERDTSNTQSTNLIVPNSKVEQGTDSNASPTIWYLYLDEKSRNYSLFKKRKGIDSIVTDNSGIVYDSDHHLLKFEGSREPRTIYFVQDSHKYYIEYPQWVQEQEPGKMVAESKINTVHRKLLKKYKYRIVAISIAALFIIGGVSLFLILNSTERRILKLLEDPAFTNDSIYCQKETFFKADDLYSKCVEKGDTLSDSFKLFKSHYERQQDLYYNQLNGSTEELNEVSNKQEYKELLLWLDEQKTIIENLSKYPSSYPTSSEEKNNILNNFHKDLRDRGFTESVQGWNNEKFTQEQLTNINEKILSIDKLIVDIPVSSTNKKEAVDADEQAYLKCSNVSGCKKYIEKFPKGKHIDEVNVMFLQFESDWFLNCVNSKITPDDYLKYFKDVVPEHTKIVKQRKEGASAANTTKNKTTNKTEITSTMDLFNALEWKNVRNGRDWFDTRYDVSVGEQDKNYIFTLVFGGNGIGVTPLINRDKYETAYSNAAALKNQGMSGKDLLNKLAKGLKQQ